jgi:hypothetical protein
MVKESKRYGFTGDQNENPQFPKMDLDHHRHRGDPDFVGGLQGQCQHWLEWVPHHPGIGSVGL